MRADESIVYRAVEADDVILLEKQPYITYIELDGTGQPWLVAFLCPCGCGETCYCVIRGAIENKPGPTWILKQHQGTISLEPSVHRCLNGACGAHFYLTQGRIRWC